MADAVFEEMKSRFAVALSVLTGEATGGGSSDADKALTASAAGVI